MTVLFVAIFGSTLVGFGVFTSKFLSEALLKEFDDALYNYAVDVANTVSIKPTGYLQMESAEMDQAKLYPFSLGTALIQVRHNSGAVIAKKGPFPALDLPYEDDLGLIAIGHDAVFHTLHFKEKTKDLESSSYRLVNYPLDESPSPQLILQVAVPLNFVERQIQSRKIMLSASIPLIIIIATIAGFFVSSSALKPIQQIILKSQSIGSGDLSQRVPVPGTRDEVQNLALTINQMLDRLEKSFTSQERFVADASHQLLTPLSIIKGDIDQTLKTSDEDSKRSHLESIHQEVDHLISLVKNLLVLARTDAGSGKLHFKVLHLDELILEAISKAEKLTRKKNIKIKFDIKNLKTVSPDRPQCKGEEDLISTLVFNLIENAVKYSPDSGSVNIVLEWYDQSQILRVEDSGPGIPNAQLENIFNRFYRLPQNEKQASGFGLGLAIVRQIAKVHDADVWAESKKDQGSCFCFKISNLKQS